ncbi:MAG: hypothetical protein ISP79_06535 [Methylophilaceae bacterium]|nr:hypothetical protein [Methylophilaceae bacterium]
MILTDKKSITELIGLDIVAEIADDYVHSSVEDQAKFPVIETLKDALYDVMEDDLGSQRIAQLYDNIDWNEIAEDAIDAAEVRLEAKVADTDLDGYIYDRETGYWEEKKYY